MRITKLDTYSDVAFANIVKECNSLGDCAEKLGYFTKGQSVLRPIKIRIEELNIDTSHFYKATSVKRTFENVFCKNSDVNSKTLKIWYKKGEYSSYKCAICGQEPFWNGKDMPLILDHINGYNKDNRLENLRWVCPNCNMQLETTNGKNINHGIRKIYYCIDCGKKLGSKQSVRCIKCEYKHRSNNLIVNEKEGIFAFPNANKLVIRNELKEMLRSKSFLKIGKYYGVTDNAVKKWCKKLNLPYKKEEILMISDEEWKNL